MLYILNQTFGLSWLVHDDLKGYKRQTISTKEKDTHDTDRRRLVIDILSQSVKPAHMREKVASPASTSD